MHSRLYPSYVAMPLVFHIIRHFVSHAFTHQNHERVAEYKAVTAFCILLKLTWLGDEWSDIYTTVGGLLVHVHLVGSWCMLMYNHSSLVHISSFARLKHEKLEQFIGLFIVCGPWYSVHEPTTARSWWRDHKRYDSTATSVQPYSISKLTFAKNHILPPFQIV